MRTHEKSSGDLTFIHVSWLDFPISRYYRNSENDSRNTKVNDSVAIVYDIIIFFALRYYPCNSIASVVDDIYYGCNSNTIASFVVILSRRSLLEAFFRQIAIPRRF